MSDTNAISQLSDRMSVGGDQSKKGTNHFGKPVGMKGVPFLAIQHPAGFVFGISQQITGF
jgi:hypothetical protein